VSDFPYHILRETGHRPWAMPDHPWLMRQSWHDLLFAHWPLEPTVLRGLVPPGLALDLFDGRAWVGVIPFHMSNVAPRGVPCVPIVSAFPELNVRTYVTLKGKPGVYFFSLDAGSSIAVAVARTLFHLPYYGASIKVERTNGAIAYDSQRHGSPAAGFAARYAPVGPVQSPEPGSLEHFLTERYCLYTTIRSSQVCRLEVHHLPWPLQVAEADITTNTMAEAVGITLPAVRPLCHFARRLDMIGWGLERVS
jgi:uncharacterized protein YqjF (DUF2071 family)